MTDAPGSHGTGNAPAAAIATLVIASLLFLRAFSPADAAELQRQPAGTQPGAIRTTQPPDLTVVAVSNPPANASPGASITVTDTTRNIGPIPAPATYTKYYLSADLAVGNDIALSGQRFVPQGLVSGAVNTGTVTVSIPAAAPSGTYYLLACADAGGAIPEANEGNNCRFSSTTIMIGLPDLVLSMVTTGTPVVPPGGWIRVADSTRNLSHVPTAVDTFTEYSLSTDLAIGNDIPIGKRKVSDGLVAGDQIFWNTALTLPPTTPPGTYYVYACADATKAVTESDEGNNCRFATEKVTVGFSDLAVVSVSNPPAIAAPGDNIAVTDTTRNLLQVPSETAVYTEYYLSTDPSPGNDIPLGRRKVADILAGGADGAGTQTVTIPQATPLGSYYLLACADYPKPGWVHESNEENNCISSQTRILVERPDLTLVSISTTATGVPYGGRIKVTDTAKNAGLVPAVAQATAAQSPGPGGKTYGAQSPAIVTRYFLSTDLSVGEDTPIGSRQVTPGLAPGATDTGTVDLVVPSTMLPGTYFLGACIDANGVVAESNEQNNCLFSHQKLIVRDPQPGDF